MAKEEPLAFPGVVSEALPNAMFRVQLEDDREIVADIGETLRKGRILLAVGDRVMVEMTAYDLIRGRILLRVR